MWKDSDWLANVDRDLQHLTRLRSSESQSRRQIEEASQHLQQTMAWWEEWKAKHRE